MNTTIFNSSGAPHVPKHILEELYRFNPNIKISWSEYPINPRNSRPRIHMLKRPAFHVWLMNEGKLAYLFEVKGDDGLPARMIDRKNTVDKIRGDLFMQGYTVEAVETMIIANKENLDRKRKMAFDSHLEDLTKANKHLLEEAIDGSPKENRFFRDPKIVSYEGQENRGTRTPMAIPKTDKEAGMEISPFPDASNIKA